MLTSQLTVRKSSELFAFQQDGMTKIVLPDPVEIIRSSWHVECSNPLPQDPEDNADAFLTREKV
ncbi:hypothetical protein SM40611_22710, partial [Xanthomonas hortorum pv. gardneri]